MNARRALLLLTLGLLSVLAVVVLSVQLLGVRSAEMAPGPGSIAPRPRDVSLATLTVPRAGPRDARAWIAGRAFAVGEDSPLAGMLIELAGQGPTRTLCTDEEGRFVVDDLQPGEVELRAAPRYPMRAIVLALGLEPGRNDVELAVEPSYTLSVQVLDATAAEERRGRPVPDAEVRLVAAALEPDGPVGHSDLARSHTDDEGRCVLVGIPSGRHVVRVEAGGFLVGRLELPFEFSALEALPHLREGSTVVRLTPRGSSLVGRAIDREGRAVSGALACLDTRTARRRFQRELPWDARQAPPFALTDAAGHFELALPPAAAGAAVLLCPGRADLVPVLRVELPSGHSGGERVIRVPPASPVVLSTLHADGRPALGRISVGDGELAFDLASDPLLNRIPGFESRFVLPQQPGELALPLPDGGYTVLFEPAQGGAASRSFYIRVPGDHGRRIELLVDA